MMNRNRLFLGSCFSLISTSVCFAVIGAIMGALKSEFALNNEQVGYIGGAAIWGFTVSIFVLGPLCDALGMKNLMRFAAFCHIVGALIMIVATKDLGFWMLFSGALILSFGNGTVEAVCNPLIATLYPEEKTKKLNQFHVWFPGGIVIGGVSCFLLDKVAEWTAVGFFGDWRLKVALVIIPTIIYAFLFIGQQFPATERVQKGVSFADMVLGAVTRPLFLILLLCMCITASLELGPGRWIPAVLQAGGIEGILVLAYINGLMAVLRFFAGPVVHKLSPTGILVGSAVLAGVGLLWFSSADSTFLAFASATVFAVGVCYFWPTMLGVVAERVPTSGAFGLALMGGMGMLAVGVLTAPQMGSIADRYVNQELSSEDVRSLLDDVVAVYPVAAENQPDAIKADTQNALDQINAILAVPGPIPAADTASSLRTAIAGNPDPSSDATKAVVDSINAILQPADNKGGLLSFRYLAPFSIIIIIVFATIYLRDRTQGGYTIEKIEGTEQTTTTG